MAFPAGQDAVTGDQDPSVASLLAGIVRDLHVLVEQEIALGTQELRAEVDGALASAARTAAAGVIGVLGMAFLALGAALALPGAVDWPPWAGFVAVGAGLGVVGATGLWRRTR